MNCAECCAWSDLNLRPCSTQEHLYVVVPAEFFPSTFQSKQVIVVLWAPWVYPPMLFSFFLPVCLSQDQGCLPGLVIFLDNGNPKVVLTALEVHLHVLLFLCTFISSFPHPFFSPIFPTSLFHHPAPPPGSELSRSSTKQSTIDEKWSWPSHQCQKNY